jgi:hypothetical protein
MAHRGRRRVGELLLAVVEFDVAHENVVTVERDVANVADERRPVEARRGLVVVVVVVGRRHRGVRGRSDGLDGLEALRRLGALLAGRTRRWQTNSEQNSARNLTWKAFPK